MDEKVCICIPTLNEEDGITHVVNSFRDEGYSNILVIDGGSTDRTRQRAENAGAWVHEQTWSGAKGAAMQEAMAITEAPVVVFVDGDATYEAEHTGKLLELINDGADHVLASRFDEMDDAAMSRLHRFGNWGLNLLFTLLYGQHVTDVLTGFRAIRREAYTELTIGSTGFGIETELTAKSICAGHDVRVVPSAYYEREGESELQSFRDGFRIARRMVQARFL